MSASPALSMARPARSSSDASGMRSTMFTNSSPTVRRNTMPAPIGSQGPHLFSREVMGSGP